MPFSTQVISFTAHTWEAVDEPSPAMPCSTEQGPGLVGGWGKLAREIHINVGVQLCNWFCFPLLGTLGLQLAVCGQEHPYPLEDNFLPLLLHWKYPWWEEVWQEKQTPSLNRHNAMASQLWPKVLCLSRLPGPHTSVFPIPQPCWDISNPSSC